MLAVRRSLHGLNRRTSHDRLYRRRRSRRANRITTRVTGLPSRIRTIGSGIQTIRRSRVRRSSTTSTPRTATSKPRWPRTRRWSTSCSPNSRRANNPTKRRCRGRTATTSTNGATPTTRSIESGSAGRSATPTKSRRFSMNRRSPTDTTISRSAVSTSAPTGAISRTPPIPTAPSDSRCASRICAPASCFADTLTGTSGGIVWANDNATLFYVELTENWRPYLVKSHRLGHDVAEDRHIYEESGGTFFVSVEKTQSEAYLLVSTGDHVTNEVRFIPADAPDTPPRLIAPRRAKHEYDVEHHGDVFLHTHERYAQELPPRSGADQRSVRGELGDRDRRQRSGLSDGPRLFRGFLRARRAHRRTRPDPHSRLRRQRAYGRVSGGVLRRRASAPTPNTRRTCCGSATSRWSRRRRSTTTISRRAR